MNRGQGPRDPNTGRFLTLDAEARFWSYVARSSKCWVWTSTTDPAGYGQFFYRGRKVLPHRFAYELLVGPIPDGLTIDHLCRNRACVRPDHLEPVTPAENNRRAMRDRCKNGHPFTEDNTTMARNRKGSYRVCLTCKRAALRRWRARKAAA